MTQCHNLFHILFSDLVLVCHGQHTIMRSKNVYCNCYKLSDQNVVLYSSITYYDHEFVNNAGFNNTNSLEHVIVNICGGGDVEQLYYYASYHIMQ